MVYSAAWLEVKGKVEGSSWLWWNFDLALDLPCLLEISSFLPSSVVEAWHNVR